MKIKSIKKIIPWYIKFIVKILLSFIPNKEKLFRSIGIYKLGHMKDPGYSINGFISHLDYSGFNVENRVVLEVGPGDAVSTGIIAWSMGAKKSYLIDNGNYATKDIKIYKKLLQALKISGNERVNKLDEVSNFDELLQRTNTIYLNKGLESLRKLESSSIDYCFSRAVLEHIFLNEFPAFVVEIYRVLKFGGLCSHKIDLKDHLGESLNSLRFNQGFWESELVRRSGFYTNRLRCYQIEKIFQISGFDVLKIQLDQWDKLPIQKRYLSLGFKNLNDEELKIKGMFILCRK